MANETLTTKGLAGLREDLSSVITRVSPEKTPFLSSIGTTTASNQKHEWQNEELDAVAVPGSGTENAQVDGFIPDVAAAAGTTRLANVAQLFSKTGSVSGSALAGNHAGISNLLNRSKVNRGIALKRDKEAVYLSAQASRYGDEDTPARAGGVLAWIKTNVDAGTNFVAGGYDAGSALVKAPITDGIDRTLTQAGVAAFNNVQQSMFTNGATADVALMGAALKSKFSAAITGTFETRGAASGKDQAMIYSGADVFIGEFGAITIVPHPYPTVLTKEILFVDHSMLADAVYRPIKTVELAKNGDRESYMMTHEATLEVKNEKGLGLIRDVTAA